MNTSAVGPLSAAQMRTLARVAREGKRGMLAVHLRPANTRYSLRDRRLIENFRDPTDRVAFSASVRITDLGRRVLVERASDDAFGLGIDPGKTIVPLGGKYAWLVDHRDRRVANVFALDRPLGLADVRYPGAHATLMLIDRWPETDDDIARGNYYFLEGLLPDGTCTVPGSPEGGWCRLLDLAIDAGLQLPEPQPPRSP